MASKIDELLPLNEAAELVGAHRNTLSRWVKSGKLKATREIKGNVVAAMVSVAEVRRLVGDGLKAGRPPAEGKPSNGKRRKA